MTLFSFLLFRPPACFLRRPRPLRRLCLPSLSFFLFLLVLRPSRDRRVRNGCNCRVAHQVLCLLCGVALWPACVMADLSPSDLADHGSLPISLAEMSPTSSMSWEMEVPSMSQVTQPLAAQNESVAPLTPVEATPKTVIRCKKLFQAGASWVTLGASNTNCHAYRCWLHRVKMIICSNTWSALLEKMSPEDQEWLVSNSMHHMVTEKLWVSSDGS